MELSALAPEDLAVRRLRLHLPPGASGSLAAGVRGELDCSGWPRAPGQAWVLVRQVSVRASRGGLAARAAAALDEQVRAAADAGSHGEERAMAVRFRDLADLIARLCADLAGGRAAGRWYWQRWPELLRLPAGEAILALLADQVERLATVTERLAGLGALASVWGALAPVQALALHERLAVRLGHPLLHAVGGGAAADLLDLPSAPPALRQRWAPALAGLPQADPRRRLAAHLVALEWRPLWIADSVSARLLDLLASRLEGDPGATPGSHAPVGASRGRLESIGDGPAGRAPPVPDRRGPDARAPQAGGRSATERSVAAGASDPGVEPGPCGTEGSRSGLGDSECLAMDPAREEASDIGGQQPARGPEAASRSSEGHGRTGGFGPSHGAAASGRRAETGLDPRAGPDEAIPPGTHARARDQDAPASADPDREAGSPPGVRMAEAPGTGRQRPDAALETSEGGLFYLVNFLARPEAQARLRAGLPAGMPFAASAGQGSSGWLWLWDLGRRLGLSPDDVLAAFLAERLDLECPAALADLPGLPAGPDLYALGERLYGTAEIWRPGLIQVPARLRHTPSHLDLDYPLSSVRLPVRRVALDVNPGWVPWLGRVLTFHYLEDWRPGRSDDRHRALQSRVAGP